ncbi:tetratricopeptide repeat protein [bacterium]|nr:tetratricopeptide repeat protein [bacterium]
MASSQDSTDQRLRTATDSRRWGGPKRWARRFVAVCLLLIAVAFVSKLVRDHGRFDPNMPEAEAKRITDQAVAENDVTSFVRIQNEYWGRRLPTSEPTFGKLAGAFVRYVSKNGILASFGFREEIQSERIIRQKLLWKGVSKSTDLANRPRLLETVLHQLKATIDDETQFMKYYELTPFVRSRDAGEVDERLMRLYDEQLRTGDALDRLFRLVAEFESPDALCDWVSKSMEANVDFRGLESTLISFQNADPANPFVQRAMGLLRWSQGRFADAEPLLRSAAMQLDDDPLGRFAWAESRRELGLPMDAEKLMGSISPGNPNYRTQEGRRLVLLAKLFETAGDSKRATESLEKAVKINPWEREAWFRLASLHAAAGDAEGSKQARERAEALESVETAIRKAHEAYRRGDRRPEAVLQAVVQADDARFDAVIAGWRAFCGMPASKSPESAPVPELFFAARPRMIDLPRNPADWLWLDESKGKSETTSAGSIAFESVPAEGSGLQFTYASFAGKSFRVADVMGGGVAVFDYDGDGRVDIFFPQGCPFDEIGKPDAKGGNRLFRNLGGWKFEDVTEKAGVAGRGYGMGVAVGDYDGDGKPDLFVTGYGNATLFRNRGDGTFEDVTDKAGLKCKLWTTAAAFADLDGDGDQDLFAVTYVDAPLDRSEICPDDSGRPIHCSPGRFEAQPDKLWENRGDGTFVDISESSGIAAAQRGRGLGLAVIDLDDDGRLDLFVANDASPNFFFRNEGGLKFRESADEAGLAVDGSGRATASMGVVAEDLDADGRADIFHTNFLNESNTFRKNLGGGLFQDTTLAMGLSASSLSKTGFGAIAADADRDGFLDLFVTNGHLDNQPWINVYMAQKPLFYRGNGAKGFSLLPESAFPYLSKSVVGRGMAAGDFDNDGLVDLVIVHRDAPVELLRNVSANAGNWIGFEIRSNNGGLPPAGTVVELQSGGKKQVRHVAGGTGYLSHSDSRVVFGLGAAEKVDSVTITWPEKGESKSISLDDRLREPGGYRRVEIP